MATDANSSPSDGITGGYTGHDLGLIITMATFTGIAWYNAIELIVLIFVTFKKFHGLYFWSLLISASCGVIPYSLGFLMKFLQLTSATWLSVTFLTVGWYAMVTGQSIVLFSRLHLVTRNPKILKRVLYMILIVAVLLHVPTTVLTYGSNFDSANHHFITGYNVMEKIQMTGFCLQEFILSGIYISEAVGLLKDNPERGNRKITYQLLSINFLIIMMDIGLLVVEFVNLYIVETTLKGVVYSIKLKLEFAVLGKLVNIVGTHSWKSSPVTDSQPRLGALPDFVDATRVTSDVTHATPPPPRSQSLQHPFMDQDDVSMAMFEHSDQRPEHEARLSTTSGSWSGETRTNRLEPAPELEAIDFGSMARPLSNSSITTKHHPV